MNIETMSRAELECEILENDELYQYFGGDDNIDEVIRMSDEEVREKIREWIIEGDETCPF
jgi:hypothetical protein